MDKRQEDSEDQMAASVHTKKKKKKKNTKRIRGKGRTDRHGKRIILREEYKNKREDEVEAVGTQIGFQDDQPCEEI